MYCKYCGKELKNNSAFCGYCGKQLHKSVSKHDSKPIVLKKEIKTADNTDVLDRFPIAAIFSILIGIIWFVYGGIGSIAFIVGTLDDLFFPLIVVLFIVAGGPFAILYLFLGCMLLSRDIKKIILCLKTMRIYALVSGTIYIQFVFWGYIITYLDITINVFTILILLTCLCLCICIVILSSLPYKKLENIAKNYYNSGKSNKKHLSAGFMAIIAIPFNIILGRIPEIWSTIVMFMAGSWFVSPYKNNDV